MPYLRELRVNWRPLAASFIGMGAGLMMASYVMGIMAPYLIADLGWQRSQFALVTALGLVSVLTFPIAGRLADTIGVRSVAAVGAIASPLLFLALSQLHDLRTYVILFTLQCLILVTTTPPIYCRVVVQRIKSARGLALAIVTSGPAFVVAVGGPLLNDFVAAHGWRAGYLALAAFTSVIGLIAVLLLPAGRSAPAKAVKSKTAKGDYAGLLRSRVFWTLLIAHALVSFPQSAMMTQLSVVLADNGVSGAAASAMISLFAAGMLAGRFFSGLALDRFAAPLVAMTGGLLSAVGLFIFASDLNGREVLMLAALLIGLTAGAEGDVVAYLVARNFGLRIYSSIAGIIASTVAIGSLVCAISLSAMLSAFGNFTIFMLVAGIAVTIGSVVFLLLPFHPVVKDEESEAELENTAQDTSGGAAAVAKSPA